MNVFNSFHRCLIYSFLYTGRLQYDAINASVIEFNEAISGKYNFLQKGFQAMGSMQEKKRFKVLHKAGYGKNRVNDSKINHEIYFFGDD